MSKQTEQERRQQEQEAKMQLEAFRIKVQEQELVARSNKSEYDTMYYYIEARKIKEEFFKARQQEAEDNAKYHADIEAQIKQQVEEQNFTVTEPQSVETPANEEV